MARETKELRRTGFDVQGQYFIGRRSASERTALTLEPE
jgi:hypothetical protein